MAEHEVVKPAKRIRHHATNKETGFWRKLLNIIGEILIIVFAISFSLFMERRREHKHDKSIEKNFLSDLRTDLKSKLKEFKSDSFNYASIYNSWKYLYRASENGIVTNEDSVRNAAGSFGLVLLINPNNSLFESMKSSGKLNVIRDKTLLQDVIALYQEDIPGLLKSIDQIYYPLNAAIARILTEKRIKRGGEDNIGALVRSDNTFRNTLESYYKLTVITGFYGKVIERSRKIIAAIDEDLGKEELND